MQPEATSSLIAHVIPLRPRRRHLLLPLIAAVHLILFLLLMMAKSQEPPRSPTMKRLQLIDLGAAPEPAAAAPEPPRPTEVIRPDPVVRVPVDPPLPAAAVPANALPTRAGGTDGGCDIADALQQRFMADLTARDEIGHISPAARSVANAVMLWHGAWAAPDALGGAAILDRIKRRVIDGLRSVPAECLPVEIAGPRFILVGDASGTTTLVFGSGRWQWAQLLREEEQARPVPQR